MIGIVQKTFNKFCWRKADKNRTYKHNEIQKLEQDLIDNIRKALSQPNEYVIDTRTMTYEQAIKLILTGDKE